LLAPPLHLVLEEVQMGALMTFSYHQGITKQLQSGTETGIGNRLLSRQAIGLPPTILSILEYINRSAVISNSAVICVRRPDEEQVTFHSDCHAKVLVVFEAIIPVTGEQLSRANYQNILSQSDRIAKALRWTCPQLALEPGGREYRQWSRQVRRLTQRWSAY
jgi:hypothetical protein